MKTTYTSSVLSLSITLCAAWLVSAPSARSAVIVDSVAHFSGVQGNNGWFYGYRNVTGDGGAVNYDPVNQFIAFAGGEGLGPWDGANQFWTGTAWDLAAPAAPWTSIGKTNIHPNGVNNAAEHWAIRRWTGDQLDSITAIAITWHMRKQGTAGNGVSGGIYTNGIRADWTAIEGTNTTGVTRTYYLNAHFGMYIDLVLGPVGPNGVNSDSSDGSFNWMVVDNTIPAVPRQPDGTIFIPHNAPDSDGDGLPDIWENAYAPGGDLTYFNATTDKDGDGSNETQEFQRSTDPTDTDTDDDTLSDGVETNTGTFVDASDTGTHPRNVDTDGDGRGDGAEVTGPPTSNPTLADTDGDGFNDGSEVSTGHNPDDATHNPNTTWIAHSETEFSGVQGQSDWFNGYRNYTADGGGNDYDAVTEFIPYAGGEGMGAYGPGQFWRGTYWDLNTGGEGPWTSQGALGTHPNGVNSAPNQEHWAIRRWAATELANTTPVVIIWRIIEENLGGSGVTGSLHVDGKQVDRVTIAGGNTNNPARRFYVNLNPTNVVDLAITPEGPGNNRGDGADGSITWFRVDPTIPANPVQPDGTPFVPATGADSDADGLLDAWEQIYFPNDLTAMTGTGDNDGDGLNNIGEFTRDTDPTKSDTDGDSLSDRVETNTGTFVDANDTGTNPRIADSDNDGLSDSAEISGTPATNPTRADSDGDGISDGLELAQFTDPNSPALAYSIAEFNGVQGSNGWYNGYRNYTADGGALNYDPATQFIPYAGGAGLGPWDINNQHWTGSSWDLNTAGAAPWTYQDAQGIHPNGVNSAGNQEHWAIRRWAATELTNPTPAVIIWRVLEENLGGSGVTGSLHVDGQQIDFITIAGGNNTNPVRRFYVDLNPTNVVDLALTPEGPGNVRHDGSDGSFSWFWVDTSIPREPRQPDGTLFIPASSPDSDSDGLADFWERVYANDLTTFTGNGDNDGDGLNNSDELQRDANPLSADTDGDGLSDNVETKTGTFFSAEDTGTHPRRADTDGDGLSDAAEVNGTPSTNPNLADTDGDGFSDGSEVNSGHDPNDPMHNPNTTALANSFAEFSDTQGQADWYYGYRDLTADGGASNYDPVANFIPFDPGTQWNGTYWDLTTAEAAPWTELGRENTHPNGNNNGSVHWSVRRWTGGTNDLTEETPVAFKWHLRKSNAGGNGVTGAIYINGQLLDTATIAGTDVVGINRTYYAVISPTDVIDLIHSPRGTDDTDADGADGSLMRLLIDTAIPPNPRQPDGTPFAGLSPELLDPVYSDSAGTVTLRWRSRAGKTYTIDASPDLATWSTVANDVASAGAETSHVDTLPTPRPARRFYRIAEQQ